MRSQCKRIFVDSSKGESLEDAVNKWLFAEDDPIWSRKVISLAISYDGKFKEAWIIYEHAMKDPTGG